MRKVRRSNPCKIQPKKTAGSFKIQTRHKKATEQMSLGVFYGAIRSELWTVPLMYRSWKCIDGLVVSSFFSFSALWKGKVGKWTEKCCLCVIGANWIVEWCLCNGLCVECRGIRIANLLICERLFRVDRIMWGCGTYLCLGDYSTLYIHVSHFVLRWSWNFIGGN